MNPQFVIGIYGIHDTSNRVSPVLIHDHNFSVFSGGKLTTYLHLERITRQKHDARLPLFFDSFVRSMKLVGEKNMILCSVDHEIGKSFISSEGRIRFEANCLNPILSKPTQGKGYWFDRNIPAYNISHELAHIYSCVPFFGNFKNNSLLIHFDGGASVSNFSAWTYKSHQLSLQCKHYKLKWLTNLFNANALVFKLTETNPKFHLSVPGKFMGLASYGEYNPKIEDWLKKNNFFSEIWSSPHIFLDELSSFWGIQSKAIDSRHSFFQDIAATIHEIFVRESLDEILNLKKQTGCSTLYFTGGCALSIKLNSALLASNAFDDIYIPPCTNDSGLSLGACAAISGQSAEFRHIISPYINKYGIENSVTEIKEEELIRIAHHINSREIIGICNDFGESGPRALGNRSILARADSKKLADRISIKMKGREWYRPVAPLMLEEHAAYYTGIRNFPKSSEYMLFDFKIIKEKRDEIKGVVHVDGTSRIQVVKERKDNPFLYDLLVLLYKNYGIRALINTSFNTQGSPMVHTPADAVDSAKKMQLDKLVINGKLTVF